MSDKLVEARKYLEETYDIPRGPKDLRLFSLREAVARMLEYLEEAEGR